MALRVLDKRVKLSASFVNSMLDLAQFSSSHMAMKTGIFLSSNQTDICCCCAGSLFEDETTMALHADVHHQTVSKL